MKRLTGFAALLLALLLPLQGFARSAACEAPHAAAAEHCAGHHPEIPTGHLHHECGACCCMAVTALPTLDMPGRPAAITALPTLRLAPHPFLLTDRLDRPPRV